MSKSYSRIRDSIFYDVDGVANNPGYFLAVKVMNGIQQVIPSSLGKYFDLEGGRYGDIVGGNWQRHAAGTNSARQRETRWLEAMQIDSQRLQLFRMAV